MAERIAGMSSSPRKYECPTIRNRGDLYVSAMSQCTRANGRTVIAHPKTGLPLAPSIYFSPAQPQPKADLVLIIE